MLFHLANTLQIFLQPSYLKIHQSHKNICQVLSPPLRNIGLMQITIPIFKHDPLPHPPVFGTHPIPDFAECCRIHSTIIGHRVFIGVVECVPVQRGGHRVHGCDRVIIATRVGNGKKFTGDLIRTPGTG